MINHYLHQISSTLADIIQILLDLHFLAILIINITRTPGEEFASHGAYTSVNRVYRIVEFLAGLITPLAKR